jgi:hypothetical protein
MIKKNKEYIRLEFGNGDICVAGGYTEHENNKITGFVLFTNQDPREIGSKGIVKVGEVNLEDYPVVMTFSKKESIDVIIKELEEAKSNMNSVEYVNGAKMK